MFNQKPCPLCSGTKLETWRTIIPSPPRRYQIVCAACYYCGKVGCSAEMESGRREE